jgi:hypothetical protein
VRPSRGYLALARLEAPLGLVNDINPALTAHDAIVAMATTQRLQRIANFHSSTPFVFGCRNLIGADHKYLSPRRQSLLALAGGARRALPAEYVEKLQTLKY